MSSSKDPKQTQQRSVYIVVSTSTRDFFRVGHPLAVSEEPREAHFLVLLLARLGLSARCFPLAAIILTLSVALHTLSSSKRLRQ